MYFGYTTAELDHQYDIAAWLKGDVDWQAHYRESSAALDSEHLDLPYAHEHERQRLDLFRPEASELTPAIIFIHGGYWRAGDKSARRFPAPAMNGRGIAWVPINYGLAPNHSMDQIVHDVRQAISWLHRSSASYGIDQNQLYVCGNSAGGHLSASLLMHGWHEGYGVPENVLKGCCAISGIFDLEAMLQSQANGWLHLTPEQSAALSPWPARLVPTRFAVGCGGLESPEFQRQSEAMADHATQQGLSVARFTASGEDHYSILQQLATPQSELFEALIRLVEAQPPDLG